MGRETEGGAPEDSRPASVPLSGPMLLANAIEASAATRREAGESSVPSALGWPTISPVRPAGEPTWGSQLGRYLVLREVGSGGMGVVLAAYDPDLERKVALKVLHEGVRAGSAGALRMLREAQAMARLSHPNVAQVYEVAEDHGRLFLAMEFIAGKTLREWASAAPRQWREVLRVYIEAGRGLAAAHAAGLMHRDFKPDNAMLGADGRVRVLDFGLSRMRASGEEPAASSSGALQVQVTVAGSLIGTPAYMSPEQFERKEADARSDQFSFCVALWEALYGIRPFPGRTAKELGENVLRGVLLTPPEESEVPAWVRRLLERGLAVDPARRWPTMDALLAGLSRDASKAWWRWGAVAGVLAIAGASYGVATYRAADLQMCGGAADEMIGVWDPQQRSAVEQALRGTEAAYAERAIETTVKHLNAYAERWVAVHTAACTAHQRGRSSSLLLDRQMACLRQRRSELAATVAVLGQTTRETVAQAVDTARGLPSVELCEDTERLQQDVAPPEDPAIAAAVETARGKLARLQALERSGRYSEALAAVLPMVGEAEQIEYLPYLAEVHLLAGKLFVHGLRVEARFHLDHALQAGLAARHDWVVAEGLALQVFEIGYIERHLTGGLIMATLGWGFLRRIGEPPRLMALMHNNLGAVESLLGRQEDAIRSFEAGLRLLDTHLPRDPLRWAILHNLAESLDVTGHYGRAAELVRPSIVVLEGQYGGCAPLVASFRLVLAVSDEALGRPEEAIQGFEVALTCLIEGSPGYAVLGLADLGSLYLQRGDGVQVRRQLTRTEQLVDRFPEARLHTIEIDILRAKLDLAEGRVQVARDAFQDLRARAMETSGAASDVLGLIDIRLGLIAHREGDDERALLHLQRIDPSIVSGLRLGERGLHAFTLAQVLHALGREPERVQTLIDEAIAAYTAAGVPYARNVAEVQAWRASLAENGAPASAP